MTELEAEIRRLTTPLNGQYPRPWLTDYSHPETARVFVVGYNQASEYAVELFDHLNPDKAQDLFLDSVFHRNAQTSERFYNRVREICDFGRPSDTRTRILDLRTMLRDHSVEDSLETNVICYSTPSISALGDRANQGGKQRGRDIFDALLRHIKPPVIIAHGTRTYKALRMGNRFPMLPDIIVKDMQEITPTICPAREGGYNFLTKVFAIPSLSKPEWNNWHARSGNMLLELCHQVRETLTASE